MLNALKDNIRTYWFSMSSILPLEYLGVSLRFLRYNSMILPEAVSRGQY